MIVKRLFDVVCATTGVLLLMPLFCLIALWIKMDSPGSVFFRQERVGRQGRVFRIYKFRTMCRDAEARGRQLTVGEDLRITRSGRMLRRLKLDELPQLLNVIKGEMSLVGPRPEVPKYVDLYPKAVRERVLSVTPGITDFASIEFKDENAILGRASDPEKAYIEEVLPVKLNYYERYVNERSLCLDFKLILATLYAITRQK